jgi:hypothetical protein
LRLPSGYQVFDPSSILLIDQRLVNEDVARDLPVQRVFPSSRVFPAGFSVDVFTVLGKIYI